jgi:hypothetical protein
MGFQHVADSLGVRIDSLNARSEISAIPLHDNGIFGPVLVFELGSKRIFQRLIVFRMWI